MDTADFITSFRYTKRYTNPNPNPSPPLNSTDCFFLVYGSRCLASWNVTLDTGLKWYILDTLHSGIFFLGFFSWDSWLICFSLHRRLGNRSRETQGGLPVNSASWIWPHLCLKKSLSNGEHHGPVDSHHSCHPLQKPLHSHLMLNTVLIIYSNQDI